jgi:hypothetical protein
MELQYLRVEFWSTSFAAPKPSNMNLDMELVGNYPPMPLVSGKKRFVLFFPFRVTPLSLSRDRPCCLPPLHTPVSGTHRCNTPLRPLAGLVSSSCGLRSSGPTAAPVRQASAWAALPVSPTSRSSLHRPLGPLMPPEPAVVAPSSGDPCLPNCRASGDPYLPRPQTRDAALAFWARRRAAVRRGGRGPWLRSELAGPATCAACARRTRGCVLRALAGYAAAPRACRPAGMCRAPSSPTRGRARGCSTPAAAPHATGAPSSGRMFSVGQGREGRSEADVWDQHVIRLCCILFLELLAKHPLWTSPTPLRAGST